MQKEYAKINPIPGHNITLHKDDWYEFLLLVDTKMALALKDGNIRYGCVRGGDSDTQTYQFQSNFNGLLTRVKLLYQDFIRT